MSSFLWRRLNPDENRPINCPEKFGLQTAAFTKVYAPQNCAINEQVNWFKPIIIIIITILLDNIGGDNNYYVFLYSYIRVVDLSHYAAGLYRPTYNANND